MAQREQNEEELHCHGRIPGDLQDIHSVPRVCNPRVLALADGSVQAGAEERREDDPLDGDEEELDADEMPVQERVVLLRDLLLELHNYEYLPDVEAAADDLEAHKWEINIVSMVQNVIDGHVAVERELEAVVKDREHGLHDEVEDEDYRDVELETVVGLLGEVRPLALKLVHAAAAAETVVDLADFVEHGPVDSTL